MSVPDALIDCLLLAVVCVGVGVYATLLVRWLGRRYLK